MNHVARAALSSAAALCALAWSGAAAAQAALPTRTECLEGHRNAQELKQSGKFLEAQEHLQVCSAGSCPGAIITDCGNWITELEQTTPSLVFQVRLDGKEALDANVMVDGKPVTDRAHAFKVNPGRHTVRVELASFEPREEDVVLPEGQRMRMIEVDFSAKPATPAASAAPAAPPPKELVRPTPVIVYPLLGLGVAGLAGFGTFSLLGNSERSKLEDRCEPRCTDDDLTKMKRWYTIGDVSAGVGAAALLGAAIVYLARPSKEVDSTEAKLSFELGPVRGATASSIGLGASSTW
ncbi:MAG: hypothetical protein EOO73_03105 [Myxococcales bacterium]|nr:MAG: hypothetical protein EOO73_03105 [Myxococcales bacterium]